MAQADVLADHETLHAPNPAPRDAGGLLPLYRELGYPEVPPVPEGVERPTWSVMIPTYNCATLLRETLAGVLAQDPGPQAMQIEVVDDCSTKDDPEAVVAGLGAGRVAFHRHARNIGAVPNFNACLVRARGHYVHILHGDDLVLPGFYTRMQALLDAHPEAGSAHCHHAYIDEDGLWTGLAPLPWRRSGPFPEALACFATACRSQFAAAVLRRALVERIGGFHTSLVHTADWDMWRRAARHAPALYEPTVLACYRMFEGNDTSRLVRTGADMLDMRRSIALAERYLPAEQGAAWTRQARRWAAELALTKAGGLLRKGDLEAASCQLREALRTEPALWRSRRAWRLRARAARLRLRSWLGRRAPSGATAAPPGPPSR
jgi:hypothetical protein